MTLCKRTQGEPFLLENRGHTGHMRTVWNDISCSFVTGTLRVRRRTTTNVSFWCFSTLVKAILYVGEQKEDCLCSSSGRRTWDYGSSGAIHRHSVLPVHAILCGKLLTKLPFLVFLCSQRPPH